jgi:hypothetical protein
LLSNGGVLVTGGLLGSGALTSAEVYNSVSRTWNATTSLGAARYLHTATLLLGGKVLVAGGYNNISSLASAERYLYRRRH